MEGLCGRPLQLLAYRTISVRRLAVESLQRRRHGVDSLELGLMRIHILWLLWLRR